jgi:glutamine---fructose-6-phosphate transaminase (isomerizing)
MKNKNFLNPPINPLVMNKMLAEILEIPARALEVLNTSVPTLPLQVPYLGMGSSYFAPLAFKYMGLDIYPEMASEYFNYLSQQKKKPSGVILSQSGKSSEALWCSPLFERYCAISNYPKNTLSTAANVSKVVELIAGDEHYSSSKTYLNTLLVLFKGFGFDPSAAVDLLTQKMDIYAAQGKQLANAVFQLLNTQKIHGIYITGSGPNIATAMEAALILSECTKLNFHGLPMAQYDHGPKETAQNSIVIQIIAPGKSRERTIQLSEKIAAAGAHVFTVEEPAIAEHFSILHNIIPFNFMAYYLAQEMGVEETFAIGGKITEVQ